MLNPFIFARKPQKLCLSRLNALLAPFETPVTPQKGGGEGSKLNINWRSFLVLFLIGYFDFQQEITFLPLSVSFWYLTVDFNN